jgi:hypothetical protein
VSDRKILDLLPLQQFVHEGAPLRIRKAVVDEPTHVIRQLQSPLKARTASYPPRAGARALDTLARQRLGAVQSLQAIAHGFPQAREIAKCRSLTRKDR